MCYLATFDLDFLKILLFVFDEVKNGPRYLYYLGACKISLNSMHLRESYVCATGRFMRADFLECRIKEISARNTVS